MGTPYDVGQRAVANLAALRADTVNTAPTSTSSVYVQDLQKSYHWSPGSAAIDTGLANSRAVTVAAVPGGQYLAEQGATAITATAVIPDVQPNGGHAFVLTVPGLTVGSQVDVELTTQGLPALTFVRQGQAGADEVGVAIENKSDSVIAGQELTFNVYFDQALEAAPQSIPTPQSAS